MGGGGTLKAQRCLPASLISFPLSPPPALLRVRTYCPSPGPGQEIKAGSVDPFSDTIL